MHDKFRNILFEIPVEVKNWTVSYVKSNDNFASCAQHKQVLETSLHDSGASEDNGESDQVEQNC